jgi:hypothetical protein
MSDAVRVHTEFAGDRPPGPKEVMAEVGRKMYRGAKRAGDVLEAAVHSEMSQDAKSGHSMRSVTAEVDVFGPDHMELSLGSSNLAVKFQDQGTGLFGPRRQVIRPVKARVHRFPHRGVRYGGQVRLVGNFAYAAWVRGVRPRNYFERAYEASRHLVDAIFNETGDEIAQVLA